MVEALARDGYVFVHAAEMRALLTAAGSLSDWPAFAASWNTLELDHYMADGGRYRRRRHAVYTATVDGAIVRGAHQLPRTTTTKAEGSRPNRRWRRTK